MGGRVDLRAGWSLEGLASVGGRDFRRKCVNGKLVPNWSLKKPRVSYGSFSRDLAKYADARRSSPNVSTRFLQILLDDTD